MAHSRVQVRVPDSALVARARELLLAGPVESDRLISYVCQIPGAPKAVAEHLAHALLDQTTGFGRDQSGRWMLLSESPPTMSGVTTTVATVRAPKRPRDLAYVVVDVETTGSRAFGGDRITEIAAVSVRNGAIAEVFETLVNPQRSIPPFVTALTRITWAMVKNAPLFRDIAPRLVPALHGQLFVAHNAAFDWRFVSAEIARASGGRLEGERLCTVKLARAFLPHLRRRSLDSLAHYYGVEITARHRAAGDAVATAEILLRLLGEAESQGCVTLEDVRLATIPTRRRRRRRRRGMPQWSDGDFAA
jgi:DNA polymerase III subunit epsilon